MIELQLNRKKLNLARKTSGIFIVGEKLYDCVGLISEYAFFIDEIIEIANLKVGETWENGIIVKRLV